MTIEVNAIDDSPEPAALSILRLVLRRHGNGMASLYAKLGQSVEMAVVRVEQRQTGEIFFMVDNTRLKKLGFKMSTDYGPMQEDES